MTTPSVHDADASANSIEVSFEFFPPYTEAMDRTLWNSIERLTPLNPRFVSVTYGAGGTTRERTHAIVKRIAEVCDVPPAAHLTCVQASRSEVAEVAREYAASGVNHIVALRGDAPGDAERFEAHPDGYANAAELVAGLREVAPFELSVGAYPEVHPEAKSAQADIDHLKRKIDAGADRAITQFFFDADVFLRFVERCRTNGIDVPIVPGILPVHSFKKMVTFAGRCGANVPAWLADRFEGLDDNPEIHQLVAASTAAELCSKLKDEGVREFHFYTLNRAELSYATCHLLGLREGRSTQAA